MIPQRDQSMLTFESASVQGVTNIVEKLTVSCTDPIFNHTVTILCVRIIAATGADADSRAESTFPKSTTPSRHNGRTTSESAGCDSGHGYGRSNGTLAQAFCMIFARRGQRRRGYREASC